MRIRALVVLAACSAPSSKPTPHALPPPAPVPAPAPAPVPAPVPVPVPAPAPAPPPPPLDIDAITISDSPAPHACTRYALDDYIRHPCKNCGEGGGGHTADELGAAAAARAPLTGTCDVRLRDRLEASIARAHGPTAHLPPAAWDHHSPPAFHDVVSSALALTPSDEAQLARDGVAVPARLSYSNFASAYYDVHRAQLPLYVSADSILHAIYASHDHLLAQLERQQLNVRLDDALGRMHCALAIAAKDYPHDVAIDLDLYLTVARALLGNHRDDALPAILGTAPRAAAIVALVRDGGALTELTLFGRRRAFDPSAYVPRGHYAGDEQLDAYFRAAMWLSRLELNLVSRDTRSSSPGYDLDPSETPREAVDALALADLAERAGALAELDTIEHAWASLAGAREDISLRELVALRKRAKIGKLAIPASADALRAAIGDRYERTVNVSPSPSVPHLAVIATLLGPRITGDTAALGRVADAARADMAGGLGFALGHDRTLAYVVSPSSDRAKLDGARAAMQHVPVKDDLYGAWFDAIRALADHPDGATPSFMATPAFHDLRLASALAAYGQLRHNHVLVAAQLYDVGGCEIPDAYVEPVPHVYDALARWAKRGQQVFASLDPKDETGGTAYFKRAARLLDVLATIARRELANVPLTADEKRFLSMVVEMRPAEAWNYNGSFPLPTYDGWYIDLFPNSDLAFDDTSFIADYATHDWQGSQWVDYLGARGPRMGMFVVDVGGGPRLMVGPVAHAYAAAGPIAHRFSDDTAKDAPAVSPWEASYVVAAPAEPAFAIAARVKSAQPRDGGLHPRLGGDELAVDTLELTAERALGDVTIDLRDHHLVKLRTITVRAGADVTKLALGDTTGVESLLVHVGAWAGRVDLGLEGSASAAFGGYHDKRSR